MAEEVLVGEQLTPDMIKSGELLVVALDKLDVVVKGAYWLLLPDQRDWRLVIASPEVRVGGQGPCTARSGEFSVGCPQVPLP